MYVHACACVCMCMCVCLKTFLCRHSLSTKDTHKLRFIKAVSTQNFQHVEVLLFLLSRRLSLRVKLGIIELKPSIHLREKKTFVYIETCTVMFIAVLFTLTKRWKQPKRPSPDKWRNIIGYICTMESYLTIKRNEILMPITWMHLKNITLSEESHAQNST